MLKNFVLKQFQLIGLNYEAEGSQGSIEEMTPILDTFCKFRDNIKNASKAKDWKLIFDASDDLRDNLLPELGVRLEDKGN